MVVRPILRSPTVAALIHPNLRAAAKSWYQSLRLGIASLDSTFAWAMPTRYGALTVDASDDPRVGRPHCRDRTSHVHGGYPMIAAEREREPSSIYRRPPDPGWRDLRTAGSARDCSPGY
jgi:hypothetical protein